MNRKSAVVAIGGNSLIKDRFHQTVRDQYVAAGETWRTEVDGLQGLSVTFA